MRKLTHEDFVKRIEQINPNIIILSEYTNCRDKIKCQCKIDGYIWFPSAKNLFKGSGCPKCSQNIRRTHEMFVDQMKEINPHMIFHTKYHDVNTKIKYECLLCGHIGETLPKYLMRSGQCPKCRNEYTHTTKGFVELAKQCNDKVDVIGEYNNKLTKVKVRCKKCNYEWYVLPNAILKNGGCPKCNRKIITTEEFQKTVEKVNPYIKIVGEYTKGHNKIECMCKRCGKTWEVEARRLTESRACPYCCRSKGELRISNYLDENQITYIPQKIYDDLYGTGGGHLSYDFYLPDFNLLIEYQGELHDRPVDMHGLGEKEAKISFQKQQEHDRRKKEYALNNHYNFLEIWYYDYDKIEHILANILN